MKSYLLELRPFNPLTGVRVVRNFSSNLYDEGQFISVSLDPYPVRLNSDFTHELTVFPNNLPGTSQISIGSISINNVDGRFDHMLDFDWGGAEAILKEGDPSGPLANFTKIFTGSVIEISADRTTITFLLRDKSFLLIDPLQKNKYTGTGSSEGVKELKDIPKPLAFGLCENLAPVLVDPIRLIYQIHDGPIVTTGVYDDAVQLYGSGNVGTYADLENAVVGRGLYLSCNSLGFFRLGAAPAGVITADCQGQFYSSFNLATTLKEIILARTPLTAPDINSLSFDTLTASTNYRVSGIFIQQPDNQMDAFIEELVAKVDAFWFFDSIGRLTVKRFEFTTPSLIISPEDVSGLQRILSSKPVYSVAVQYKRNLLVQEISSFGVGSAGFNGFVTKQNVVKAPTTVVNGEFSVFLGNTKINDLGIVYFQKMNIAPWLVIGQDGKFVITAPAAGTYTVTIAAQLNEFQLLQTITIKTNPVAGLELTSSSQKMVLNLDGTHLNGAAFIDVNLTRVADASAVTWSATTNLGQSVTLSGAGDTRRVTASNIPVSPQLISVTLKAVSASSNEATHTIILVKNTGVLPAEGGSTSGATDQEIDDIVSASTGNMQPNANMFSGSQGYVGPYFVRELGASGAPSTWVLKNVTTSIPPGGAYRFPNLLVNGAKTLWVSIKTMRTGPVSLVDFTIIQFNPSGSGLSAFPGMPISIVPTVENVWQTFEFPIEPSIFSKTLQIWIRDMSGAPLGTFFMSSPRISLAQSGADITSAFVPRLDVPATQVVKLQTNGTPVALQLPRPIKVSLFIGETDVSSTTTFSFPGVSTGVAEFGLSGSASLKAIPASGKIPVEAVYRGKETLGQFSVITQEALPDTSGGGGGGGVATSKSISEFTINKPDSATYTEVIQRQQVVIGSGGTLTCTAPLTFYANDYSGGYYGLTARWRYRVMPSGPATDIGSPVNQTNYFFMSFYGSWPIGFSNGIITINPAAVTGLTSGDTVEVWLEAKTNGDSISRQLVGTCNIAGG